MNLRSCSGSSLRGNRLHLPGLRDDFVSSYQAWLVVPAFCFSPLLLEHLQPFVLWEAGAPPLDGYRELGW